MSDSSPLSATESAVTGVCSLLHVGCGPKNGARIPRIFSPPAWREIRLDIDPAYEPDILGTMLDMAGVADASIDALYSSHNIEHLFLSEIPIAMKEFLRVLKPDGYVLIVCPDLLAAAQMIMDGKLMEVVYSTGSVHVTPLDIIFGHHGYTGRDKPFMSHHCGFTLASLIDTLKHNGFACATGLSASHTLWAVASKQELSYEDLGELAKSILSTI